MSVSENAKTTHRIIDAITAFDFDTAHDLVAEDVVVEQPYAALGQPERYEGRDAFIAGLRLVPTVFKEFTLTITELYECPARDTIIFEQSSRGVFNADGAIYENKYIIIFGFRDGKVAFWREFYNPEIMNRDMGAAVAKMQNA